MSHDDWPWVKDLSRLGRDLARTVIVDDNPLMFMYQPDNALHVAAYDPQVGEAGEGWGAPSDAGWGAVGRTARGRPGRMAPALLPWF